MNSASIGFTFNFIGTNYTTCNVSSNGFLTFGSTAPANNNYSPISSTAGYAGAISAFGRDLGASTGQSNRIKTTVLGSSPNRVFVVEWRNCYRFNGNNAITSDDLDFQIRLSESTNVIEIVYGASSITSTTSLTCQVGLRGSSNTDFDNRNTTSNWAFTTGGLSNTASCTSTNSILPGNNLCFRWTPPAPACVAGPTAPATGSSVCAGTTTLSWPAATWATGYDVYFNNGPLANTLVSSDQPGLTYTTGVLSAGTHSWRIVPRNATGSASGCSNWNFTVVAPPTIANAGPTQTICTTGATVTMAANTATVGTGSWTQVSGTAATITTPSLPTSTITGLNTAGTRTFRWTITNSPCAASTSDVTINVNAPPTASNAGPDQIICATSGSATMAANNPATGTGSWSQVSGPGTATITTPTSRTTTITGMTTPGDYTFRWTISNAPCTASTNDVVITVSPQVTSIPGTYGPLCANDAPIGLNGTPVGGTWSGTGVSGNIFSPSAGTQTLTYAVTNGVCSSSNTTTITVDPSPGAPTVNTGSYTICQNGTVPGGQGLSATCSPIAQTATTSFPGSNFASEGTTITTRATLTMPPLPAGAVVTAARLKLFNVVATNGFGSFDGQRQNIRVALSGSYTLAETQLTTATGPGTVVPDPVITLTSFPATGGTINLRTRQTTDQFLTNPDATIASALIEVDYTFPTVVRWYDSPTAGTLLHTGPLFDPVAQGAVINTNAGTTTFYATCAYNSCENIRVATSFTVNTLADAGTSGTLTICSNASAVSLSGQLGGTPTSGGNWSGPSSVLGGVYDPATMDPGVYTYTVTGAAPCPDASATVTVTEDAATTWFADVDGDGYGDASTSQAACIQPTGYVANNTDLCTADANKQAPGQCGCGVPDTDSDGDATADCNDGCPNDPNKIAPGICGCGASDVDTDGDATADCNDGCPNDPNKIAPGICGCGATDTDTDGDATADCNDGCPNDPNKVTPGQCGCGNAETDSDGDGTADCIDGCPTDPTKISAGICGCETPDDDTDADGIVDCIDPCPNSANNNDTDADGTPDCLDLCPNDPAKINPGTCGCGVADGDSDGDTYADCADACPNDPLKIAPGLCGCNVPEVDTDGDTYFDCVDACPNDPLKIGPGTCGCGVADADTDNDGTLDCNDGCPSDGNKTAPGTCGCGTPDTDTDSDGLADCVDSCPMLAGGIGDACDDGNANTLGDVISATCTCAGNTVITCTMNEVHLFIRTDGQAAQTSWVIETLSGGTPMCSGSNYANNTDITVPCCIPNGSYALRVMDSFGDGMGNGAGYVLRMADGRRIIDNEHGCSFTVMSSVAQGFTLPLSNERITSLYCDREDLLPSDFIRAVPNAAVSGQLGISNATSGYGFWLFDPDGGYSRRINITHATNNWWFPSGPERATFLKLSSITTNPVPTDQYLNVRVRTMVNGVTSAYGPACRFRIDLLGNCPTTGLVNDVNDPMHSCGIAGVMINGSRTLHVTPVSAATTYQWEFTSGIYLRRITSAGSGLNLAPWATNPLEYGKTYGVRVRVSFDNGVTYCPFGPACSISTAGTPSADAGRNADQEDRSAALAMWPNPNSDGVLHLTIDDLGMHLETADLVIYDMTGRRVHNERIAVNGESLNTVSTLPGSFGPGVYLVNIIAGERSYVKRLVIR